MVGSGQREYHDHNDAEAGSACGSEVAEESSQGNKHPHQSRLFPALTWHSQTTSSRTAVAQVPITESATEAVLEQNQDVGAAQRPPSKVGHGDVSSALLHADLGPSADLLGF